MLVGHWPLISSVTDFSGFGRSATANNITYASGGKIDNAASFNGTTSYVDLGDPSELKTNKISVSAWFKTSASGSRTIARKRTYGYELRLNSGVLSFSVYESSGSQISATSTLTYNDNTWHHVAGTYDGTDVVLYIDGEEAVSTAGAGTGVVYYSTGGIAIGRDGDSSSSYFSGSMNDVRFYDHALSAREVYDISLAKILHYSFPEPDIGGVITDTSGYRNNGALNGGMTHDYSGSRVGGGLYYFDGSDDTISLSAINSGTRWTLNAWLSYSNQSKTYEFFTGNTATTGNIGKILLRYNGNVSYSYPAGTYNNFSRTSASISGGEAKMLTFVANGTSVRLYVDGQFDSSVTVASTPLSVTSIGNAWSDNVWLARFDLYAYTIYASTLTDSQVSDLYSKIASFDNLGNVKVRELNEENFSSTPGVYYNGTAYFSEFDEIQTLTSDIKQRVFSDGKLVVDGEFSEVD
jgi:hypothetical protein